MVWQWVSQAAATDPAQPYLEDASSPRTVTYAQLHSRTVGMAGWLQAQGAGLGSPVAVAVADPLEMATALVAVLAAGYVAVPFPPHLPPTEEARLRELTEPVATISGASPSDEAMPAGAHTAGKAPVRTPVAPAGGVMLCTSGTTGRAKVVLLAEPQLAYVATTIAAHHGLERGERGFSPLPLFHVNAEVVGLLATLAGRATLVVDDKFHRTGFWELIEKRGITWVNAVPAIITILANSEPPPAKPRQLRFVRSASAPLPPVVLRRFEKKVGVPVVESYGMTEAASMITANPLGLRRQRPGSAGIPVGTELRVVDGHHRALPDGSVGRIEIRGPGVIRAYYSGGEGAISPDGWLDTKDLGYLDADGFVYLVGRADDLINRGGESVYPREVEEVLLSDPGVEQAVVVGVPDPVLGAHPEAWVVPSRIAPESPGAEQLGFQLKQRCRRELMAFKVPTAVHIVSSLPTGPTGKVSRHHVLAAALAESA